MINEACGDTRTQEQTQSAEHITATKERIRATNTLPDPKNTGYQQAERKKEARKNSPPR